MQFKSKHEATISFTEESFAKLLDKEWNELECVMVDGRIIVLTRTQLIFLWAKTRDWRKVQHSNTKVKVLKVG
jgi:hypothetical protein